MNAQEARKKATKHRDTKVKTQLNALLLAIAKACESGKFEIIRMDNIDNDTIIQLEELGYKVNFLADKENFQSFKISW